MAAQSESESDVAHDSDNDLTQHPSHFGTPIAPANTPVTPYSILPPIPKPPNTTTTTTTASAQPHVSATPATPMTTDDLPNLKTFTGDATGARQWLKQFELVATLRNWDDTKTAKMLPFYIEDNTAADRWWTNLTVDTSKWTTIKPEFEKRWPKPVAYKSSRSEIYELIAHRVLTDDQVGVAGLSGNRMVGAHVTWAEGIRDLALEAEDTAMALLPLVLEKMPKALAHFVRRHKFNTWQEFVEGVAAVDTTSLRDQAEVELNNDFVRSLRLGLPTQPSPATQPAQAGPIAYASTPSTSAAPATHSAPLQSPSPLTPTQTQVNRPPPTPSTPMPSLESLIAASTLLRGHNFQSPLGYTPNPQLNPFSDPTTPTPGFTRGSQQYRTGFIAPRTTTVIDMGPYPATDDGRRRYTEALRQYDEKYGADARPEPSRPYPCTPGTLPAASGECWRCGMARHAGTCTAPPVPARERTYRVLCGTGRPPRTPVQYLDSAGTLDAQNDVLGQLSTLIGLFGQVIQSQGNVPGLG